MYSYFVSEFGFCSTVDQIHNGATCCLSYIANTIAADALVIYGAMPSAGMVLTK